MGYDRPGRARLDERSRLQHRGRAGALPSQGVGCRFDVSWRVKCVRLALSSRSLSDVPSAPSSFAKAKDPPAAPEPDNNSGFSACAENDEGGAPGNGCRFLLVQSDLLK